MPRVSVVMPARKPNALYLRAAVDSILSQTAADLELLVVEDEGDSTAAELLATLSDPRLRLVVNRERGLSPALNLGIAQSRAGLVARMDADDIAVPHRLERQIAAFETEPDLTILGAQSTIIDAGGRIIGMRTYPVAPADIAKTLMRYNCMCHPSVMFRKDAVVAAGGYASGLNEDYDLWCRMSAAGAVLRNDSMPLIQYRFHAAALKRQDVAAIIRRGIEIKEHYFRGRMDARARARLIADRALTLLPEALVVELFRRITYARVAA